MEIKNVEIEPKYNNKPRYIKQNLKVEIGRFNKINYKVMNMEEWSE